MRTAQEKIAVAANALTFVDMHVHAYLPVLGSAWRKRAQKFFLPGLDAAPSQPRLHAVACYETFLLRPAAARARLFRALEGLRNRVAHPVLTAKDLGAGPAYLFGVESLRYLRDPADLEKLWDLGARFLQPIHFADTPWGRSSREGLLPPSLRGLTGLGREMLAEMARLGFILDLSHMNRSTAAESLAVFSGAVMCSHTGPEGDGRNPRNLPSELAREVFRRRGLVGVTCWRRLLGPRGSSRGNAQVTERRAWTRAFCDAVLALDALAPGARVCVGSDRGAPIRAPAWFFGDDHVRELADVFSTRGWTEDRMRGFFRDHALAFLREALPS